MKNFFYDYNTKHNRFQTVGRYGYHVEQFYKQAFSREIPKSINNLFIHVSMEKRI